MACCLTAPSHHLNLTNADYSLRRFCCIYLRSASLWVPKLLFCAIYLKTVLLKSLPHLPGAIELKFHWSLLLKVQFDHMISLVQVMAWLHEATSHNLNQYCATSVWPHGCIFAKVLSTHFFPDSLVITLLMTVDIGATRYQAIPEAMLKQSPTGVDQILWGNMAFPGVKELR